MFALSDIFAALRFGVLGAALVIAPTATAGDEQYRPPLTVAPMPDVSVESMWEGFARDVGLTSEELAVYRADLPAGIDDLMWILQARGFSKHLLESNGSLTADDLLFEKPSVQLLMKEVADLLYGSITTPHPASSKAIDEALWEHFAAELVDFVPLRASEQQFTAADALWVKIARDYDAATLREQPVTAYDLLDAADYLLHRKLVVDHVVESMLDCAVCAVDRSLPLCAGIERCDRAFETNTELCRTITRVCRRDPVGRPACAGALAQCI